MLSEENKEDLLSFYQSSIVNHQSSIISDQQLQEVNLCGG
jgi:hypothetical protein